MASGRGRGAVPDGRARLGPRILGRRDRPRGARDDRDRRRAESRRPAYVKANREWNEQERFVAQHGLFAYIRHCATTPGKTVPYPFCEGERRLQDIAADAKAGPEWPEIARWMLQHRA